MNIILYTKRRGRPASISLTEARCLGPLGLVAGVLLAVAVTVGYQWGEARGEAEAEVMAKHWAEDVRDYRGRLAELERTAHQEVQALSARLGRMQAHVIRLDALGQRLTQMAELDAGEFDFTLPPAQGGPDEPEARRPVGPSEFQANLDTLDSRLEDRARQLAVLETLMVNRQLQEAVEPAGRPIRSGWLSSYYGNRTDPFTGQREFHHGVDFAGKEGAPVVAVAAGVVTWADDRQGYGKLVEIDHGNGYVTRYGHNQGFRVSVGDKVERGEPVATMGSTGRSTGPHVHFEVRYNGRVVNPGKYVKASR